MSNRLSFKTDSNKEAIIFTIGFTALITLAVLGVVQLLIKPDTPIDPAYDNKQYADCMELYYHDIGNIKSSELNPIQKQEGIVNFGKQCAKIVGVDKVLELDQEQNGFNLGFTAKDRISKSCFIDEHGSSLCYGNDWINTIKKEYGVN